MTPEIIAASDQEDGTEWTAENIERTWCTILPHVERERRKRPEYQSEAKLERKVLLRIGEMQRRHPTLLAYRNEVGVGFQASCLQALAVALRPFGAEVVAVALGVLKRYRVAFGVPGSPDLWVIVDGRACGLELKTEVGRLSDVQKQWHAAAERRGCFVTVVRSVEEAEGAVERCRRGELR